MAVIFEVKVVPSSGCNKWVMDKSGKLKCYLKSAPERGLANYELISLIAKALKLTKMDVEIVSGQTSRNKKVKVLADIKLSDILEKLGVKDIDLGRQGNILG
ncbi:MAG: hypothetical protein UR26_C0008G0009 [candidate division TM6 bacterium GW2011_GWF2_32_72]|jgi:uncharacterized protein (TIGR00251 family)|nr:MAG: hypothetical protein UR26_C0008G0009 [candidate division TM6 bacterium GW2011_GWF2_32_72]